MFSKWFKRRERPLPQDPTCSNCGAQTVGRYCHDCGQSVFAGAGQPILHLLGKMLESLFLLDAKAPRTLAFIMYRPGFLSSEFRAGRINRYVHPVKLFWMSTLVFFGLLISQIDRDSTSEKSFVTISSEDGERSGSSEEAALLIGLFSKYAPYVSFVLIPIFALMLALFFWRKKQFYMHHLIFTVHFHTYLWIYCGLLLIISLIAPGWEYPGWLKTLLTVMPGVYFSIALHRYYQTKTRWSAIWKAVVISILYFIIIIAVVAFIVIFVLQRFYPDIF